MTYRGHKSCPWAPPLTPQGSSYTPGLRHNPYLAAPSIHVIWVCTIRREPRPSTPPGHAHGATALEGGDQEAEPQNSAQSAQKGVLFL